MPAVHAAAVLRDCGGYGRSESVVTEIAKLLYLAPFDDEQQLAFARHWYFPRMGPTLGAEHAGRFVDAVRRHSAVRVIGRVPNLLYLLALLYRHRALLPHGRTHVYTAISEAYLGGIDLGRCVPADDERADRGRKQRRSPVAEEASGHEQGD